MDGQCVAKPQACQPTPDREGAVLPVRRTKTRSLVVSSICTASELGGRIGREAYSYRFVFDAFAHLLADRKSTRLNSSHVEISYAVFSLKKKKKKTLLIARSGKAAKKHRR